jgi:hypothetical protein
LLRELSANAANKTAIVAAGGVETVVTAMRRHADAAGVQEEGRAALRKLGTTAANKAAIPRPGGDEVVSAAKRRRHND